MAGPGSALIGCKPNRNECGDARLLAWKAALLCGLMLLLSLPAHSQDSMRLGIGLGEYYSYAVPTPVHVRLPAASHAQSVALEFVVRSGSDERRRDSQALDIEVPILLPQTNWSVLDVTASGADGQIIGSASRELRELTPLSNGQYLVAICCQDQLICQTVEAQVAFGGSGTENAEKNKNMRLATFREARGTGGHMAPRDVWHLRDRSRVSRRVNAKPWKTACAAAEFWRSSKTSSSTRIFWRRTGTRMPIPRRFGLAVENLSAWHA
jgi:hypothetical protein